MSSFLQKNLENSEYLVSRRSENSGSRAQGCAEEVLELCKFTGVETIADIPVGQLFSLLIFTIHGDYHHPWESLSINQYKGDIR